MATTFTTDDIELLGYSNPEELSTDSGTPFSIFETTAIAGLEQIRSRFVYLKSNCTLDHARSARQRLGQSLDHTYVVKPASLRLADHRLHEVFGDDVRIFEHEELVWKKIDTVFAQYSESLRSSIEVTTEKFFISPRSTDQEIQDSLEPWMIDYMRGDRTDDNGKVLVLSAHAGVGKTTLARHLLRRLVSGSVKTIPIFVEAQHWGKINLGSVDELWDIIDNSLRFFSPDLSLRKELFYHALRQGYLSFIFDGFDELCGHKTSPLDAKDVIQDLATIAAKSEARILVTTRTLYWSSEIEAPPNNVKMVQLDTFNTQQAKGYFAKYFHKNPPKVRQALDVYSGLVSGSRRPPQSGGVRTQFVNLPLCVAMVANYVQSGGGPITAGIRRGLLEGFLSSICEREMERKSLRTSAMEQVSSFQELAIFDENVNPEFDFELLGATNFAAEDILKLVDHPFLQKKNDRTYCFSYDFLGPYFRALAIAKTLGDLSDQMKKVMAREPDGTGYISEQLCGILESSDLDEVASAFRNVLPKSREAASFLFHICKNLVDETQVTTSTERSEYLFGAIVGADFSENRSIRGWSFHGRFDRLDLRVIEFNQCNFNSVSFRNCQADHTTCFVDCKFTGDLGIEPTGGWHNVNRERCRDVFPTDIAWEKILNTRLSSREDQTLNILRIALGKFWYHGRPRVSMRLDDWNKGVLSKLGLAKRVLEVMLKVGLVKKITISGVSEGGIAFDRASMRDLQNYMDNQQIQGKIKEMYQLLVAG